MDTTISSKLCDEKHKRVDECLIVLDRRISDSEKGLTELEMGSVSQAQINDLLKKQIVDLQARVDKIEDKPKRRAEIIVNTVLQAVTLFLLALIASRMGLQ